MPNVLQTKLAGAHEAAHRGRLHGLDLEGAGKMRFF